MQSFWFSRQLWARLQYRTLCACWQATWSVFCRTEPWNGSRNWLESDLAQWPAIVHQRAASCLRCGIGHFGKVWMPRASPPAVQSWHEPLTSSQNWRNHSVGNTSKSLRGCLMRWPPVIRRINNEGVLTGIQDLSKRWAAVIKHSYIEGL